MGNGFRETSLMKTLFQIYLEEFSDIQYCPYCLTIKGNRIVCCQEADFIEFKELDLDQQTQIIEDELEANF